MELQKTVGPLGVAFWQHLLHLSEGLDAGGLVGGLEAIQMSELSPTHGVADDEAAP
jgi:hypothetical protein